MHALRELLDREPFWLDPTLSVRDAVRHMCERHVGAMLVKDGDKVIGVFSERDLMHRVVAEGRDPDSTRVQDVMSSAVVRMHVNDGVEAAKAMMYMNRVRHLMVTGDDKEVLGLVSMRDLMEFDLREAGEFMHKLNDAYYDKAYKPTWRISSNRVITHPYRPEDAHPGVVTPTTEKVEHG